MTEKYNISNNSDAQDNDFFDIGNFLNILWFRKKIIFFVTLIGFFVSGIETLNQRINNPVFRGSFELLINDPISGNSGPGFKTSEFSFADIATNETEVDTNTLIAFLKSPILLAEISKKHGISKYALDSDIKILNPLKNDKRI